VGKIEGLGVQQRAVQQIGRDVACESVSAGEVCNAMRAWWSRCRAWFANLQEPMKLNNSLGVHGRARVVGTVNALRSGIWRKI
jgi:hypothetical protein